MQELTTPSRGDALTRDLRGTLVWRLVLALAASAAAGMGVERMLSDVVDSFALRGLLSAAASASLVGLALWRLVVIPLATSRQDLHERYSAALADSLTDPLTGLGNHRAFHEELDRQVEAAQRYGMPVALVIADLDEFKQVNDGSGHAYGDRTLSYFGDLVGHAIRRVDRAFRIGGDEFAIILPHTDAEGARVVAHRLLAASLQASSEREGQPGAISFSAGVSSLPDLAGTRAQLYSQADAAMYQAKRAGRTGVLVFVPAAIDPGTPPDAGRAVADVIANGWLRPVYQPIVELATGRLLGMEGLIRPTPPAPFADPAALFGAAAASGHLAALDMSCVEAIVAGAGALPDDAFLSINLSPTTVQTPEFSAVVLLSILARHGLPPERVVLELTEREEFTDLAQALKRLESCRMAGMRLAADDVGAGNAGLRLLSEVRFDVIKVDLGLVQRSGASAASSAVIESVVALAAHTGALVVGEGIEQPAHIAQLSAMGVTAGQGYLLGRPGPMPIDEKAALGSSTPGAATSNARGAGRSGFSQFAEPRSGMSAWRESIGLPLA
jgi:diguanylate cyclase (GGDEF)-like protein